MTKREILKWLERKRESTLLQIKSQYQDKNKALKDEAISKMGLPDVADKIESHLDAVQKLWTDWKEQNTETDGLSFKRYSRLEGAISDYRASKGDALKYIRGYEFELVTTEMVLLETAYTNSKEKTEANYANVIAVVDSMKKTKDAAEYLTSLGFDLSQLQPPRQEATALTVHIDTRYLFLQDAA